MILIQNSSFVNTSDMGTPARQVTPVNHIVMRLLRGGENLHFPSKNLHFLLKNLDFLLKNPDFLLKNLHLYIIQELWLAVRFLLNNLDFLLNDLDFLSKNPDLRHQESWFPIENVDFIITQLRPPTR